MSGIIGGGSMYIGCMVALAGSPVLGVLIGVIGGFIAGNMVNKKRK